MVFTSDRINIITGGNASGKTTILAAIYSMFQNKEIFKYVCADKKAHIEIEVQNKEKNLDLKKDYSDGTSQIIVESFEKMSEIMSLERDKVFLFSGEFINDSYLLSDSIMGNAMKLLENLKTEDNYLMDYYINKSPKYHILSGGMQTYLKIIGLISSLPQGSILLCDEPFSRLDTCAIEKLCNIIEKIEGIQFVLTVNSAFHINRPYNKFELVTERNEEAKMYLNFDYKRVFHEDVKKKLSQSTGFDNSTTIQKPIIQYELNTEVDEGEDRNTEFKEIMGNNPCGSIIDTAEIYIVAFLNSWATGIGTIKWGLSDNGIVKGVKLSKKDKDVIMRKISERIMQMKPYVSPDLIHISFENIVDNGEIIQHLYIVEISVELCHEKEMFSTSKDEVYIKTNGGKKKLDSQGIQQELKRRLRYKNV